MNGDKSICYVTFKDAILKTGSYKRTCRYHRIQKQEFSGEKLFPKGFCPHAYRVAYPYCLSLLYDSKYPSKNSLKSERSVKVRCPVCENNVETDIGIRFFFPYIIRKLKVAAIRFLQFLNIPAEYPDKDVLLRISRVKGECHLEFKERQVFKINIKNRKELCPASFYNLYPALLKWATGPQEDRQEKETVHCPDPYGVFYYITGKGINCEDFFSIKAEVIEESGQCAVGHKKGDSFKIEDVLPNNFCPLAFYSIYPYYLTLIHSGMFEWIKKGENVKVQCPKADGIIMEVKKKRMDNPGDSAVKVKVVEVIRDCPRGHEAGSTFDFDSRQQKLCFKAMAGLIPFKVDNRENKVYSCPGTDPINENYRVFKVE